MELNRNIINKISDVFNCSPNQINLTNIEKSVAAICAYLDVSEKGKETKKIFVKMNRENFFEEESKNEIEFYQFLQNEKLLFPIPHCHFAAYDEQTNQTILILEDYSDTHGYLTEWPIPPEIDDCKYAITALAKCHAQFWNHPKLGRGIGSIRTKAVADNETTKAKEHLKEFVEVLGDRINNETLGLYEKAISNYYGLMQKRFEKKKDITLCHGDAHIWNFMFKKNDHSSVSIIDWGGWEIGTGTDDLAYMVGLHWHPLRRKQYELEILEFYHWELIRNGVKNYSFKACYEDYKVSIIGNLLIPLWQWKNDVPAYYWWPHYERAPIAFKDLACENMID